MLTAEKLRKLVAYDPETGEMRWKQPRMRVRVGQIVGSKHCDGHRTVCILGKIYMVHRLAWLYVYGEWPSLSIDHINCVRDDNRLSNLRLATPKQQAGNTKIRKGNTSGYKGVSWDKISKKWRASCQETMLGYFDTAEEAAAAYRAAATIAYGSFARFE